MSDPIHYAASPSGLTIYIGAVPVLTARKDYQIIRLAQDALAGQIVLMAEPPVVIVDHAWLLRFASVAAGLAAEMVGRGG